MPRTLLSGLLLAAAAFFTVLLGAWLDLEVGTTALLGVTVGGVVALVPDTTVARRFAGFALGVVVALVGYLVRAGMLPDTDGGRAVFAALVVALCVAVTAASVGRLSLWSTLLGAATFAGAFEAAYNLAPPRVVENSTDTLTALALCVAVGFAAVALAHPGRDRTHEQHRTGADAAADDTSVLEDIK